MEELEFIIVLKDAKDLDRFYEDMESRYGSSGIPDRRVECAYRKPTSRSTHYYLTPEEALQVKSDPRVESIDLHYRDKGAVIHSLSVPQFSNNWDKSGTNNSNDVNWGLLRCYRGSQIAGWGSDGTPAVSGEISLDAIGRNVDIVIVDGHLVANHPEWSVNANGTGGTRLNRINWFQYNSIVRGTAATTYVYDFPSGTQDDHNHGNNVGAIAAGNTCGWARGANIYNIASLPQITGNSKNYSNYFYDVINYVRVWHANKPINNATGRKNRTVVNMSYGTSINGWPINNSFRIYFQGQEYVKPSTGLTNAQRISFVMIVGDTIFNNTAWFHSRDAALDADVADAAAEGIVLVGAAGNYFGYNDAPTGKDYNNALSFSIANGAVNIPLYYYHRGPSPGCATGAISVSAISDTVLEKKPSFSNAGPRTDIFSPGSNIMGAAYVGGVADPRSTNFKKYKTGGTSQATPQVTGIIACALERYPNMTPAECKDYIRATASPGQLYDESFDTTYPSRDWFKQESLYGGPNLYLAYRKSRASNGLVHPAYNNSLRATTGQTWPRVRFYKRS